MIVHPCLANWLTTSSVSAVFSSSLQDPYAALLTAGPQADHVLHLAVRHPAHAVSVTSLQDPYAALVTALDPSPVMHLADHELCFCVAFPLLFRTRMLRW
jgi:hypothetical protein